MFKIGDKVRCDMPQSKTIFVGVVTKAINGHRITPRCIVLVKKIIKPGKNTFVRTGKQFYVDNQWIRKL
jgi:hypothetical protein